MKTSQQNISLEMHSLKYFFFSPASNHPTPISRIAIVSVAKIWQNGNLFELDEGGAVNLND